MIRQPETRPSLIVRLKDRGNDAAWSEFVCVYEPFLMQLVSRQWTPERHVGDVSQQLLIAIAKSVEGWKDDGKGASFRRWLRRVARNVVIKFMTRERRQISGSGGSDFVDLMEGVGDTCEDDDRGRRYDHELIVWAAEQVRHDFHETSWHAFWATQIQDQPIADVASELGVSTGSIYMSRSRILAKIRERIEQVLGD